MSQQFLCDLASRELGGSVVAATDELFAGREHLIKAEPPVFSPRTFGLKGQLMDGWETRRRREPGHDHAIVRLGCPGVVRTIVVDTAFFTGNYPPEASVEACGMDGYPSPAELADADWIPLVGRSKLAGDTVHEFAVTDERRFSHVRLSIYPDGGVSRLRVLGEVVADPRLLPPVFDLAALEHGGRVLDCSNSFYSAPQNLIKPGLGRLMGDGWETARRRDDGNDWVSLRLACAGRPVLAEIDTTHFVGNAPGWASLTGDDGVALLPKTRLQPDTRHRFVLGGSEVSRVRLDVFPDGGVGRLRILGAPTGAGRAELTLRFANTLPESQLAGLVDATPARPYQDVGAMPAGLRHSLAGPAAGAG